MKRFSSALLVVLCLSMLTGGGVHLLFGSKSVRSERENRYLTSLPRLTWNSLCSGRFAEQLGDFCRDHIPFRTELVSLCSLTRLALGQQETGGILVGKEGFLIPKPNPDTAVTEANLQALSTLTETCQQNTLPVSVFFAPRGADVLPDQLPWLYNGEHDRLLLSRLEQYREGSTALVTAFLDTENPSSLHYKTDHHWNTDGAYLAYTVLARQMGLTPYSPQAFERVTVTHSFLGTSDSKACLPGQQADTVVLYRYRGDETVTVENETGEVNLTAFYDLSATKEKDVYRVFLGGNHAMLRINLPNETSKPRLLLIKDSYANALIPFLALHFDVDAIDPRYGNTDLQTLLSQTDYHRVLVLMGADTVSEQAGLLAQLGKST